MKKTTERAAGRSARARDPRPYLIAFLASAYVATFWSIGAPEPTVARAPLVVDRPRAPEPQRVVWISDLPAADRPVVALPAGWHVADGSAPPPSVTPVVSRARMRVASVRPRRVRTRSS